ncbi:MAG: isoleucine--tRNA ligase [bacterium]|nr:isoleucine--tRNA ligase [bacterium]
MDYNKTLNLPKTNFAMKANLPEKEREIQRYWDEIGLYRLIREKRVGRPKFVLHDGPPYANGDIHMGQALNKIMKDIIIRYHTLLGEDAPYIPGWDTHGLPTEQQVAKTTKKDRRSIDPLEWRKECKNFASKYIDRQREEFKRLGVIGDWNNPYVTFDPAYEASQIRVFKELVRKNLVYRALKPVYWCYHCETSLAEAEIEYKEVTSPSIIVSFRLILDSISNGILKDKAPIYIPIWTTTPWTLPGNTAVALNPNAKYLLVDADGKRFVLVEDRLSAIKELIGWKEVTVLGEFLGKDLEGYKAVHPFEDREVPLILGEHVSMEEGTGLVHTAPGHGPEDYEVGLKYSLPVLSPVDELGRFTIETLGLKGINVIEANKIIMSYLENNGKLLYSGTVNHDYPHCWRCRKPVIFRATEQWFIDVNSFRDTALKSLDDVEWIPPWSKNRMVGMLEVRPDWCISRQRIWGVPLPIFYCKSCNSPLLDVDVIEHIAEIFEREGSDAWFKYQAEELLPEETICPKCGSKDFIKEKDIMDVWFDSGSSFAGVLKTHKDLRFPSDMYLEGSDQHRGWFQTSLLLSIATEGIPPYRKVLTHGFVVDEAGKKMSKSLGNVIDPQDIVNSLGADVLRLWVASSDFRSDVKVSKNILNQIVDAYRKVRNTIRFMLGNLYDFDPEKDLISLDKLDILDRWILSEWNELLDRVKTAYYGYEFHVVFHSVHSFCVNQLSSFYLDVIKDRLYVELPNSFKRRSSQTTLYHILRGILRILAPIVVHTTEEAWQYLPGRKEVSIHLEDWPDKYPVMLNSEEINMWNHFFTVRDEVNKKLDEARQNKIIGSSLEAKLKIIVPENVYFYVSKFGKYLSELLLVSEVEVLVNKDNHNIEVEIVPLTYSKCQRCWMYTPDVGRNDKYPDLCERCVSVVENIISEGEDR